MGLEGWPVALFTRRPRRSRPQGTVLKHSGLLMLGVDDYFRNTSMVNADGLADDAVGDAEFA